MAGLSSATLPLAFFFFVKMASCDHYARILADETSVHLHSTVTYPRCQF